MRALLHVRGVQAFAPEPLGTRDLVIAAGRILAIGHDLDPRGLGIDVETVDGRDLVAIPGLVDSLVHIGGGGGEGGFATRTPALDARDAIAAGVTTLVGALGTDDVTRSHADLLACARALRVHGLTAFALTGSYRVPPRTITGHVRDDIVLIEDIIGVGEIAISDHRGSHPTAGELARIAGEARVGGMLAGKAGTVLVHVGDDDGGLALLDEVSATHPVPRTQWLPTHVNRTAALLDHGVRWVGAGGRIDLTASTTEALIAQGEVPAPHALARLLRGGVDPLRVTLSSDGQASLPRFDDAGVLQSLDVAPMASLLEAVVAAHREHGLALGEALVAATTAPAAAWGLAARKGGLAAGMDADVVLLDRASLRVRATIAGGQLHRVA